MLLCCFYSWMSNFWKFHYRMFCLSEYINSYNTLCQVTLGRKVRPILPQSADRPGSASCIKKDPEVFPGLDYTATFSEGYVVLAAQPHYRRYTKITSYCWFERNGMEKGEKTSLKYIYNLKCPTLHIWDAYSKSFLWSSLSLCFCR